MGEVALDGARHEGEQVALAQRELEDGSVGHPREVLDRYRWDLRG